MPYRVRRWYAPLVDPLCEPPAGGSGVEEYSSVVEACRRAAWLIVRGYEVEVEGPSSSPLAAIATAARESRAAATAFERAARLLEDGKTVEAVEAIEEALSRLMRAAVAGTGRARISPEEEGDLEAVIKLAQAVALRNEAPANLVSAAARACRSHAEKLTSLSKPHTG